jgi:hypothetical protein
MTQYLMLIDERLCKCTGSVNAPWCIPVDRVFPMAVRLAMKNNYLSKLNLKRLSSMAKRCNFLVKLN